MMPRIDRVISSLNTSNDSENYTFNSEILCVDMIVFDVDKDLEFEFIEEEGSDDDYEQSTI